MTLLEMATEVQTLASSPNILDAIDRYYADDVTVVEATGETFTGSQTQKDRVVEFLSNVAEMHSDEIKSVAAHETSPGTGTAFAEVSSDMTLKQGGRILLEQVAVQQWKDGKIVHERFYYVPAPGM